MSVCVCTCVYTHTYHNVYKGIYKENIYIKIWYLSYMTMENNVKSLCTRLNRKGRGINFVKEVVTLWNEKNVCHISV